MKGRGIKALLLAVAAVLLAAPASADAVRFATPGGLGPEPCASGAPCSIHTAVEAAPAGETVILRSTGMTYNIAADSVNVPANVTVRGEPGQPRPTVSSNGAGATGTFQLANDGVLEEVRATATGGEAVNATTPDTTIRGTYLEADYSGFYVVDLSGTSGLLERSQVVAPSGSMTQFGVLMGFGSILRDTTVFNNGPAFGSGVTLTAGASTIRNATIIATGMDTRGIYTSSSWTGTGATASVSIANSIVKGGAFDIEADDQSVMIEDIDVAITRSNFDSVSEEPPDFDVIPTAPNQSSVATPALLSHPGMLGDFHQLAGSPTIDAGVADAFTGTLDFEGQPRCLGTAPDIGADEFTAAACPTPSTGGGPAVQTPIQTPVTVPKKCKKGQKLKKGRCVKKKRKKRK